MQQVMANRLSTWTLEDDGTDTTLQRQMAQRLQALIGPDKAFDKLLAGRFLLPYVCVGQPSGLRHRVAQLLSARGSEF